MHLKRPQKFRVRRDSNPGQLGKKHERYICAIKVLLYLQQIFANELRFRPPIPSSGLSLASNLSLLLPLRPKPFARTADLNGMTRSAGRRFPDTDHQQPEHRLLPELKRQVSGKLFTRHIVSKQSRLGLSRRRNWKTAKNSDFGEKRLKLNWSEEKQNIRAGLCVFFSFSAPTFRRQQQQHQQQQ